MDYQQLYNIKLWEIISDWVKEFQRVPWGWIMYIRVWQWEYTNPVFIPFDNEFMTTNPF